MHGVSGGDGEGYERIFRKMVQGLKFECNQQHDVVSSLVVPCQRLSLNLPHSQPHL
jgi:hypothetical protein